MKRMLLSSLALALMASITLAAEGRLVRSSLSTSRSPALLSQANDIPVPALSPVPDPAFAQSNPVYTPTNPTTTNYPPTANAPAFVVPAPGSSSPAPGYSSVGQPIELFSDVRYRGTRNISPCAVPIIVQISDPCNKDRCCKTCVNVQVCVPPCDPKCVKVTRDGNRVLYDFGKYEVVVKTVGNHVVVHYGS